MGLSAIRYRGLAKAAGQVLLGAIAFNLSESAVNSLVGKRMVKQQQMRWSLHGAHMLMQVRTANLNGELRDRLRAPFRQREPNVPPLFKPKPPLLRAA